MSDHDKPQHPTIVIDRDDEPGGTIIPPEFWLPGEDDVYSTEEIAESFDVDPELFQTMREIRDVENEMKRRRERAFVKGVILPNIRRIEK